MKKKSGFKYSSYRDEDDDYEDYYGSYSRSSYRKSGSYGYGGGWSWGNYGYSTLEEEDDDLFIRSHPSYFTPTSSDIAWRLDYKDNTQKNRTLIKEFARYFYHRMIDEKEYFDDKYLDPEKLDEETKVILQQKQSYYTELWEKFIPGITPLEQAIELFKELKKQQEKQGKRDADLDDSDVEKSITGVEFHEEIYKDPIFNELLEMHDISKNSRLEILNMISMIENLGSQFKIEKEIDEKLAHNSRLTSKKIMRDYSQLHQVDMYQRLLPTFKTKMLMKDLVVTVPIDRIEHKQKIIIMIDFSGSMHTTDKQKWVLAIMIDRLKYVIKEEAEVFFSFFVNDPRALFFHHLYDRASVMKFWTSFSTKPNGGDTNIGAMIDRVKTDTENNRLANLSVDFSVDKPEILIVNDGQDSVKTSKFTYKTNAITLVDAENEELKKLCIQNNGKYVHVGYQGMKSYDKGTVKA